MSGIGLDYPEGSRPCDYEETHFDGSGLCWCGCAECTTRTAHLCVCLDCPCESPSDHVTGDGPELDS